MKLVALISHNDFLLVELIFEFLNAKFISVNLPKYHISINHKFTFINVAKTKNYTIAAKFKIFIDGKFIFLNWYLLKLSVWTNMCKCVCLRHLQKLSSLYIYSFHVYINQNFKKLKNFKTVNPNLILFYSMAALSWCEPTLLNIIPF